MLRNLLFFTVLGAASLFFYRHTTSSFSLPFQLIIPLMAHANANAITEWSSPFASWHARALAVPLPDPHAFTPTADTLALAVLLNAQAEHEGMTLALFAQPDGAVVAVDTLGRVLQVRPSDAAGIQDVAREVLALPETGAFRNTWVVKHDRTSQPIDRIFIPARAAAPEDLETLGHMKQVSVQGFSKATRELREPVAGAAELPGVLWELAGLVREAREGGWEPERRDQVVLGKVREVLRGLF